MVETLADELGLSCSDYVRVLTRTDVVRKDDRVLKKIADDAVRALFRSGEINRIYAKWFLSPISPQGDHVERPHEGTP